MKTAPSKRTLLGLDAVNFLMADVHTGVGPFVAIYLAASLHWNPRDIGIAAAHRTKIVARPPQRGVALPGDLHRRRADGNDPGGPGRGALCPFVGTQSCVHLSALLRCPSGALYTLTDNPYFLVGVQLMDGIGAAIFGVVQRARDCRSDARYRAIQFHSRRGATATGLGASLSNGVTGFIVQRAGYNPRVSFSRRRGHLRVGHFLDLDAGEKKERSSR